MWALQVSTASVMLRLDLTPVTITTVVFVLVLGPVGVEFVRTLLPEQTLLTDNCGASAVNACRGARRAPLHV